MLAPFEQDTVAVELLRSIVVRKKYALRVLHVCFGTPQTVTADANRKEMHGVTIGVKSRNGIPEAKFSPSSTPGGLPWIPDEYGA